MEVFAKAFLSTPGKTRGFVKLSQTNRDRPRKILERFNYITYNRGVFLHFLPFGTRIWARIIGQSRQIIHAGIQGQCYAAQLFIGIVTLFGLQFGVVTLVDPGQHLHFDLCITPCFSEVLQSGHNITNYCMAI